MAEQSTDERFAQLEARVAELEHQRRVQEDRDIALLARIDTFIDDLHRVERVQMRGFEELKADQQEMKAEQKKAFATVAETMRDHKQAIETLAGQIADLTAGQQQIIALLTGNPPLND